MTRSTAPSGQRIVSTIFTETNQYRVILEAQREALSTPQDLGNLPAAHGQRCVDPAVIARDRARAVRAAAGHTGGAVSGRHGGLRYRAGRCAGQVGGFDPRGRRGHRVASQCASDLSGRGRCVREVADQPALAHPRGGGVRVHRAGRAVRELCSSAHHPLDFAVGGRRRFARIDGDGQRPRRDRHHRHHSPDRHREEERDHDDRLRHRCRAAPGQVAARGDSPGGAAALSADPDDDSRRLVRRVAADAGLGRRGRAAAAAGAGDLRRAGGEPDAHLVHHAGDLPGVRPHGESGGTERTRIATEAP